MKSVAFLVSFLTSLLAVTTVADLSRSSPSQANANTDDTVGKLTVGSDPSPTPPLQGEGLSGSPFPRREGGWGVRSFFPSPLGENLSPNLSPARREALTSSPFPRREGGWGVRFSEFANSITQVPEPPPPVVVPTFPTSGAWQNITLRHTLKDAHWGPVYSLSFSRDGTVFASGGGEIDNRVRIWDSKTGKRKRTIRAHRIRVMGLAFTPDNRTLATGGDDATISLWQTKNGNLTRRFEDPVTNVLSLAMTSDGQVLISGGLEGVRLWEMRTQRLLYTLVPLGQPVVYSVAISPNQPLLAGGGRDGAITLWNVNNGQMLGSIGAHTGAVSSIAFTPDGDGLVSGSYDHTIKVWNLGTRNSYTLSGHRNVVNAVAVNPDGRTLASAGRDGVKLWDLGTGRQIGSIPGFSDWVQSVAFSPDGQLLVTGGFDGTIRVWQGVY